MTVEGIDPNAEANTWRWYCRICGTRQESFPDEIARDAAALHHVNEECPTGPRPNLGWEIAGRSLHVWGY